MTRGQVRSLYVIVLAEVRGILQRGVPAVVKVATGLITSMNDPWRTRMEQHKF